MIRALLIAAVAGAALAASCYSPGFTNCEVSCAMSNVCPSGLDCKDGFCVTPGQTCGSNALDDANSDTRGTGDAGRQVWGTPVAVGMGSGSGSGTTVGYDDPSLTENQLEMYVNIGNTRIGRSLRSSTTSMWSTPVEVTELNPQPVQGSADISSSGLHVVWSSPGTGATGTGMDLVHAHRTASGPTPFGPQTSITDLNSVVLDTTPALSKDELVLVFASERSSNRELYISNRANTDDATPWSPPALMNNITDSQALDESPYLSADKLTIYFGSNRAGSLDLYQATRASTNDPFSNVEPLTELNTPMDESDPWVSTDGKTMYFARVGTNNLFSIYVVTR